MEIAALFADRGLRKGTFELETDFVTYQLRDRTMIFAAHSKAVPRLQRRLARWGGEVEVTKTGRAFGRIAWQDLPPPWKRRLWSLLVEQHSYELLLATRRTMRATNERIRQDTKQYQQDTGFLPPS